MIRVRSNGTILLGVIFTVLLLLASGLLFAESVWEGSAAVGMYGEFPASGFYAATNAFPRNTTLVVENVETGETSSVIVVDRVSRPGIFILLSRDAARDIGLADDEIARVRVVVEEKSTELPSVVEDDMARSPDPDLNPAASVSGVEDLLFLEKYVNGEPSAEEEQEQEQEDEVEPLLPPLDEEPEEEETLEEIVQEIPPAPVLRTEDVETRIPHRREADFSLTEVPTAPAVAKTEAVLTSFDSAPLIAPAPRSVSRSVGIAPEPVVAEAPPEQPGEGFEEAPEVFSLSDIPAVPYPPERVVASAFEAPEEPYFEAPEPVTLPPKGVAEGPTADTVTYREPSRERIVSLEVAAVPEEPVAETEAPVVSGYVAPSELLYETACGHAPDVPVPDVPEISSSYLASAFESEDFSYSDVPLPPSRAVEQHQPPEEEPETELAYLEPEEAEETVEAEDVPDVVEEREEVIAEAPPEEIPVPGEVELYLEPADMRPPEPIEEIAVAEQKPAEEEPVEEIAAAEEPEAEDYQDIYPRYTLSTNLTPSMHYLQLGVFSEKCTAGEAAARIGAGYPVTIQETRIGDATRYKLFVGPLTPDESGVLLYRFRRAGYRDAFVRVIR